MRKAVSILLNFLVIAILFQNTAFAAEISVCPVEQRLSIAKFSLKEKARPETLVTNSNIDYRIDRLKKFLEKYKSPLLPHAEYIIAIADNNEIPWNLLVAIAGVESTFCKKIPKNSYNCWGWKNGKHTFENYQDAIETVSRVLRSNYFNKDLTTPEKIGRIYAPPTPSWGVKVRYFMNKIENSPLFAS